MLCRDIRQSITDDTFNRNRAGRKALAHRGERSNYVPLEKASDIMQQAAGNGLDMKTSVVIAFCAVALLAGCASAGTQVDQSKVAAFERGKTTYAQVIAQLGMPNANSVAADGSRVIVYTYTQVRTRPQSFIPIIGAFVAKADADSNVYSFTFDQRGVLVSYSTNNTAVTAGTGLVN